MLIFLLCFVCQFSTQYRDFLNSPKADSILSGLAKGNYEISNFADDPIALWFWRSNSGDPQADSLLKKLPLRKNFYLSAVLRWEAEETNNYKDALNKLNLATYYDSSAIENLFSFITLAIKYRKFNHLKTAITLPILSDFRNQIFIITNLALLLFISIIMCGVIYVLVKTIYYLPVLSHRIDLQKHNKIKGIIPFLILLIPVLVLRHLYPIIICYSFLLIFVLNSKEKNWLRLNIIILLLFFILLFPLDHFITFLKQHNQNYQLYEMVNYDTNNVLKTDDVKEKEILAYALKQQGELENALSLYKDLYNQDPRNVVVTNNLANIYFLNDELASAETLYFHATLSQDRGEPYFNLGLLKLKNIEYLESSRYMEEAQKRNFSSPRKEPVDIKPTNADFYKIIAPEKFTFSGIVKHVYLIPVLIILILTFLPLKFPPPFYCATCGRSICEKCSKKSEQDIICEDCFTKFKSTKSWEMEESLRIAVSQGGRRLRKFITYLLNIIIPGAGVIYQNRNFTGLIIVFFVMIGYVPLLFPKFFIKPADWITLSLNPILFLIAAVIAILAYIYSFALIRRTYAY